MLAAGKELKQIELKFPKLRAHKELASHILVDRSFIRSVSIEKMHAAAAEYFPRHRPAI